MKVTVRVKLVPSPEQARALEATLDACNRAANHASRIAQTTGARHKYALHKVVYHELKAEFGLSAQPTVHVLGKVADAYTTRSANLKAGNLGRAGSQRRARAEARPITFRPDAAQPFDDRCLSWQMDARTVSLWTTRGRMKHLPFVGSPEQLKLLATCRRGESDLLCQDGQWFLSATCEVAEQPLNTEPEGFVGVDLGLVEIATTSTGDRFAGRKLNRYRRRQNRLRATLQAKGTKSARRVLKRQRRREARRARDVNHRISKHIVERAERTGHGITLEDLRGIRGRVRQARPSPATTLNGRLRRSTFQRSLLHSWSFAQLRDFIVYKARRAGVPVLVVDPAYTSQSCSECGHTSRRNRPPVTRHHPQRTPSARFYSFVRGSSVGAVVWCCTPIPMLPATWPTGAGPRGTRGACQPPPHPLDKRGAGRGRRDLPSRWAPTRKPVASATSS